MEVLNKMLRRATELELFRGLKVGAGEHTEEVTHLLFADDTILFYESDKQAMFNVKCVLMSSKQFRGQHQSYQV